MEISLAGELPAIRIASNALRSREPEIEAFLERLESTPPPPRQRSLSQM
jgi:hypothetical protein